MIQDLSDLAALGEAGAAELKAMRFDKPRLAQASVLADDMAVLLARAKGETADDSYTKLMRDRAYTHLKAAVDEVRVTGRYVFRNDKERRKAYASDYRR